MKYLPQKRAAPAPGVGWAHLSLGPILKDSKPKEKRTIPIRGGNQLKAQRHSVEKEAGEKSSLPSQRKKQNKKQEKCPIHYPRGERKKKLGGTAIIAGGRHSQTHIKGNATATGLSGKKEVSEKACAARNLRNRVRGFQRELYSVGGTGGKPDAQNCSGGGEEKHFSINPTGWGETGQGKSKLTLPCRGGKGILSKKENREPNQIETAKEKLGGGVGKGEETALGNVLEPRRCL